MAQVHGSSPSVGAVYRWQVPGSPLDPMPPPKATECKQSRSAWMTGGACRRHMQLIDSAVGRKGLAHLVLGLMADDALRSGQPIERVREVFPDFEQAARAP